MRANYYTPIATYETVTLGVTQKFTPPVYIIRNQNYLAKLVNSFLIPTHGGHTLMLLWVVDVLDAELL
jgi:hypothetical protein